MEQRSHPTPSTGIRSDDPTGPPPTPAAVAGSPPPPLKKDRHIVTWSSQEDDLLRDQVAIHGTDNWTSIAARFKDKTGRQCRRRWYTYLNSECKKGGWSAEEDILLCEAQKIFGNRWTEIAKVVSGRTDNAVKNRFSTLCKKRAKHDDSTKENSGSFSNQKNKRVITHDGRIMSGISEASMPTKHIRYEASNLTENNSTNERLLRQQVTQEEQPRPPLAVLVQNINSLGSLPTQVPLNNNTKTAAHGVSSNKIQGAFFKRDDPKLTALLQQANLLSSLAAKVNTDNTSQSLEDAWKELQDYLIQTEEPASLRMKMSGVDFILDDFKDLIEDLKSANIEYQLPWREPDLHEESQGSSGYSTGSNHALNSQENRDVQQQAEECLLYHNAEVSGIQENLLFPCINSGQGTRGSENVKQQAELYSLNHNTEISSLQENVLCPSKNSGQGTRSSENIQQQADLYSLNHNIEISSLVENVLCPSVDDQAAVLPSSKEPNGIGNIRTSPNSEYSSPLQTMPLFQTLAEGLPTPKFSASERQFLLSLFGLSSPVPNPSSIKKPSCKRALLDSLEPS